MIAISNLTNGRFPTDISLSKQSLLMQTLRGAFSTFASMHVQNVRLQVRYLEEPEFAHQLRMLTALAFLPPQDVVRGFVTVCIEIRTNFGNVAEELLAYFEDTYVGRFRLNAPRSNPMLSIELWNMFHRTDAELPRAFVIMPSQFLEVFTSLKE